MIILYLPFAAHEEGDLLQPLETWLTNSQDDVVIIKHKDSFSGFPLEKKIEIYICAHGSFIEDQFSLFNQKNKAGSNIDIPTLVERFETDFFLVRSSIDKIHLYCCGNAEKNQSMALKFQSCLARPEYSDICFYSGSIEEPDINGKLWSHTDSGMCPIEDVRRTLPRKETPKLKAPTVRRESGWKCLQERHDGNLHKLFAKRNASRDQIITEFRKLNVEQEESIAEYRKGDIDKEVENKILKLFS